MLITDRPQLKTIPTGWEKPLQEFEILLRSQGRAATTIDTRIRHLRTLARGLECSGPAEVNPTDLIHWAGQKDWKPETRNSYYASIRLFFRFHSKNNYYDDPSENLKSIRRHVPPPRPAPDSAIESALLQCKPREELILLLAAELGLRAAEIAQIHRHDLQIDESGWGALTIRGKGSVMRILPVPRALTRKIQCQLADTNFLFPGHCAGYLSPRWISKLATRILPEPWTLHTLRHRFATVAYNNGKDIIAVKEALGHQSIETTQRYTKSGSNIRGLIDSARL